MATIIHVRHPAYVSALNDDGGADVLEAELNRLQRRIDSYTRLLAECAAELCELQRRVQVLRGSLGLLRALPAEPTDPSQVLSQRELQVLHMAACGLRNCEIATLLTISEGTVKNHVSAILAKLGVRSRWDAVTKARERGLI